jgi:eukaryotic-like serine/threonine-protein kinase
MLLALAAGLGFWIARRPATESRGPVLTQLTADGGLTTDPAISPDGKLVAYASDRSGEGNLDIWVQQVNTGQAIRLTRHEADDHEPAFSPDGSRIAFRSERGGGGIYAISALGGEENLIAVQGRRPQFSPDGAQIAYWVGNIGGDPSVPGTSKIFVVPAAGGAPRQVQPKFAAARYPVWSADGKQLLFWGIATSAPETEFGDWWVTSAGGGAAVKTGALAIFHRERLVPTQGAYMIVPGEWAALRDRVLFFAQSGDSTNLWQLPLLPESPKAIQPPKRLTFGSSVESQPSVAAGGAIVFASLQRAVNIWQLPIDANKGAPAREMQRITSSAAPNLMARFADGAEKVIFVTRRSGLADVVVRDLKTGKERSLSMPGTFEAWPVISRDGSKAAYRVLENQANFIYVTPTEGGVPVKVCDDCRAPYSFSFDNQQILFWMSTPATVGLLELRTGKKTEIVKKSGYAIYRAYFSPDDRWIAFHARNRPDRSAIYVVPFRGAVAIPERDWIAVTDGESYDLSATWSHDGSVIYYFSERDGSRCIWAQRLDAATKHPTGSPFAVQHLHNATRSLIQMTTNALGLSATRDKLVFNLAEISGNVWMAR